MASSTDPLWACPRCHSELPRKASAATASTMPLDVPGRVIHGSASLEEYASTCPACGLPYTSTGDKRFEYPYRPMLAEVQPRRFLRWSDAQNNGYVSYGLMRGSSCSVEGRDDAQNFADFISAHLDDAPGVVLDLGCGPLPRPAYLPKLPDAQLIGVDPFESEWSGSFIQGAGEFLPLKDQSVDMVMAATALDHTLDLDRAMAEIARVTRSGGRLMVWDHTFEPFRKRIAGIAYRFLHSPRGGRFGQLRADLLPERVRVYDNGIVLWTPKGFADPFHEPRSRRASWPKRLRRAIERAGFVPLATDSTMGYSAYLRS